MKAMILCAGKGTRLRPMTYGTPKPMIPLVDKPVLQYIVEHLRRHDVNEIAINLSYLPDRISDCFRDGAAHGVRIFYSLEGERKDGVFEGAALGSAGGMKKIQTESGFFDDTFIVLCGDAAVNLDITRLVREHKTRGSLATIVLKGVHPDEVSKYGVVALDEKGRIRTFQEKPAPEEAVSTLANTGIYIFEPEIFNHIPDGVEYDLGGDLFPNLCRQSDRFFGAVDDFDWIDIGNLKDFRAATDRLLTETPSGMTLPGAEIAPGVRAGLNAVLDPKTVQVEGPVYIGAGAVIEPGARIIGPTVIGPNSRIGAQSIIHRSVLGAHTRVRSNTFVTCAIVHEDYLINEKGESQLIAHCSAIGDAREADAASAAQDLSIANLNLIDQIAAPEINPSRRKSA